MRWKKVTETNDLLIYEKRKKELNIRIEARSTDEGWEIFKNYNDGKKCGFVEEFFTETKKEALEHVTQLINEKDLSKKEIKTISEIRKKKATIRLYRLYKEKNIEKWLCSVDNDNKAGFIVVRFNDSIEVDIVLKEKHRFIEDQIVDDVVKILGLNEFCTTIEHNVYYYGKHSSYSTEYNDKLMIGKLDYY